MGRPPRRALTAIAVGIVVVAVSLGAAGWPARDAKESPTKVATAPSPTPVFNAAVLPGAQVDTAAPSTTPSPVATSGAWTLDVYDARAVRWQNPDKTACTAASAQMMLNMAVYGEQEPTPPIDWKPDVSYSRQESILAYQRRTGTMSLSSPGADTHGWRNALNYYGWGSTRAGVYSDKSFDTFDAAVRSTVSAIALYRKPVGILGWAGNHAQIITGYRVTGGDPRTGTAAFSVVGVYLTDPLRSDGYRDRYVPLATWKSGGKTIRFTPYLMTNSPYKDPIDGKQGNAEWDGKWVVVVPVA